MDDWNDFGPDPSVGQQHHPQHLQHQLPAVATALAVPAPTPATAATAATTATAAATASTGTDVESSVGSGSFVSLRSAGAEPRSVMLRAPPPVATASQVKPRAREPTLSVLTSTSGRMTSGITESALHARAIDPAPPPSDPGAVSDFELGAAGDLDTATDFDDIGSSRSTRHTYGSTSDRFHNVSYTKLEVISAQQIQQLLHGLHILVAMSLCWCIFTVVCSNALFSVEREVPARTSLLSEAQIEAAIQQQRTTALSVARFLSDSTHSAHHHHQYMLTRDCFLCRQHQQGSCLVFNEWYDCAPRTLPCHAQCGLYLDHTSRSQVHPTTGEVLTVLIVRFVQFPPWYKWIAHMTIILCGSILFVLGSLYLIRIVRVGRESISQEQIFACAMLFMALLYFSIPLSVYAIHINLQKDTLPDWYNKLETPFTIIRDTTFTPFLIFFLWANIHSYRILDPRQKLDVRFYMPKIAILFPYAFIRLLGYFFVKLFPSEVPLISAVILQRSFGNFNFLRAYPRATAFIIALTLYEVALVAITVWQMAVTMRQLRRAPYMRHRSKHTGFRFFIYLNFVFYISLFLLQVFLAIGVPRGNYFATLFALAIDLKINWSLSIGTIILIFGYVVITAYVNLPYDSVGAVKGWFKGTDLAPSSSRWSSLSAQSSQPVTACLDSDSGSGSGSMSGTHSLTTFSRLDRSARYEANTPRFIVDKDYELNQEIVEPVTYRKRESRDALELKANCFTMQTHVIMFNFAWYVYYYGTPKVERLNHHEKVLPFQFDIAESIREESTDTQVLVINCSDRIVVTFKGSTSLRNLRTSLAMYHERLRAVVPTDMDDNSDELKRLQEIFGRYYEAAKIHKGFAMAYASVSHRVMRGIKRLHDERPRPVFLTGHSLGGALATICSLDVWIKLRISRRQIFVSTFGSPRVGNEAFKRIYNSVIALHWRIVVDPDMVAKMPKVGFRHVGKKVLLTQHGDLFIDPSALELKLWSGSTAGFAYHRKASYLLAMQAWCLRHHKLTYRPRFWQFPVRDEDRERFEGAIVEAGDDIEAHSSKLVKKIILLDAMVDSLDDGVEKNNSIAVEKWARLTRRLLLRQKLANAVNSSAVGGTPGSIV